MSTLRSHPYWGVQPEILQQVRQRAHEERTVVARQAFAAPAKIIRQLFVALTRRAPAEPNLRIAHEH